MTIDERLQIEESRIEVLLDLNILDTENSPDFDNLTNFAASLFDVPIVAVSLVDTDRQWFKSCVGLNVCETSRDVAFCDHVVRDAAVLNVPDTHQDIRFANNPLVTEAPFIRSYLGYPLSLDGVHILGTLCLIDTKVRHYTKVQIQQLARLAEQVESLIKFHKVQHSLIQSQHALELQVDSVSKSLARYDALLDKAAAGIISIDERGVIQSANTKLLALLGYDESELLGQNVKILMPQAIATNHDTYLERYQRGQHQSRDDSSQVIGEGRELEAIHKEGHDIAIHLAVSEVINPNSNAKEFIGIITDIREQKRQEQKINAERSLLSTLHSGITNFTALLSGNQLWEFLQQSLLELTQSDYSFIGEVVGQGDASALKIHAITDLSWNEESSVMAAELKSGERLIDNKRSLLGKVFANGETVIVPDMTKAKGKGGQPEGHPTLHNYLGIPIVDEGVVIGMYAIANCQREVNEELAQWLEPFTSTCSLLIRFYRMISEKEHVLAQLTAANNEIEAASRAKSEFLSSMSHELRTPLNSIIGFSQLMLSQTKHPLADKQVKQAEQIHTSGKHLLTLINEILDLAKIEAGKLSLSIEPSNVGTMVEESVTTIMPMADTAGISISIALDKRITVLADYTRFKQVLINLLSNAIKYNRANGSVVVSLAIHEMFADIQVTDTGIGVDMSKLDELFEPFNRLGAENSTIEGTGVGLALTKKLVEYMNGEILVNSSPTGTTFTVRLPLAEECLQLVTAADNADTFESVEQIETEQGIRVLYVEDNPANQNLMEDIFEELEGFVLYCSPDPLEGFELAKKMVPDLMILDINLPHIDGFELFSMIKSQPSLVHIPVMALSANAMPADIAKGLSLGFNDYLTKPVDIPQLLSRLDTYQSQLKKSK